MLRSSRAKCLPFSFSPDLLALAFGPIAHHVAHSAVPFIPDTLTTSQWIPFSLDWVFFLVVFLQMEPKG